MPISPRPNWGTVSAGSPASRAAVADPHLPRAERRRSGEQSRIHTLRLAAMRSHCRALTLSLLIIALPAAAPAQPTAPAPTLVTRFAADVDAEHPLPEYPRPQLVRDRWLNLNGQWDYAIVPGGSLPDGTHKLIPPEKWQGRIVVPFCAESTLSGVKQRVGDRQVLWYRRTFKLPAEWNAADVVLNFGAVDWESYVWVNGEPVTPIAHRGGYDPFGYRIGHLLKLGAENEIVVRVWDPTDTGSQPRGKQVAQPEGIWYTPVTGIWQTVWLEAPLGPAISAVHCMPDLVGSKVRIEIVAGQETKSPATLPIEVRISAGGDVVATVSGETANGRTQFDIPIATPHVWTPDDPFLYDVEAQRRARWWRHGDVVLRYAFDRHRPWPRWFPADAAQWSALVPVRPARSGLVAGWALHRADRCGAQVRHRDDQAARLQHGPQARQGRAAALVLLVRQARPLGLAGHAQRHGAGKASGGGAGSAG